MGKRRIEFAEETVVVAPPKVKARKLADVGGGLAYDPEFAEYLEMKRAGAFTRQSTKDAA